MTGSISERSRGPGAAVNPRQQLAIAKFFRIWPVGPEAAAQQMALGFQLGQADPGVGRTESGVLGDFLRGYRPPDFTVATNRPDAGRIRALDLNQRCRRDAGQVNSGFGEQCRHQRSGLAGVPVTDPI